MCRGIFGNPPIISTNDFDQFPEPPQLNWKWNPCTKRRKRNRKSRV